MSDISVKSREDSYSDEESLYGADDVVMHEMEAELAKIRPSEEDIDNEKQPNQYKPLPPDNILKPIVESFFWRPHLKYDSIIEMIKRYYGINIKYTVCNSIFGVGAMSSHFCISPRSFPRKLKEWGLSRRHDYDRERIKEIIGFEISKNDNYNFGYRSMYDHIIETYKIWVKRDDVAEIMKELDPEGVERRKQHRLVRRKAYSLGPNDCWCYDGHDKLKKFGIAIHGAVDLFSKYIIWLECGVSNNKPEVIAVYYLRSILKMGGIPQMTMSDCGTETVIAAALQVMLVKHSSRASTDELQNGDDTPPLEGANSYGSHHRFVKSTHNQAIEHSWEKLLRHTFSALIDNFQYYVDQGVYDPSNALQRQVFKYVFLPNVQHRLNTVKEAFNNRYKRRQKKSMLPSGCSPFESYHLPEKYGGNEMMIPVEKGIVKLLLKKFEGDCWNILQPLCEDFRNVCDDCIARSRYSNLQVLPLDEAWQAYSELLDLMEDIGNTADE